jgi:hypothetical protein
MSLDKAGFLSPEIGAWIGRHRAENTAWFSLADRLNEVAHRQMAGMESPHKSDDNGMFLAALLFLRGLTSYQAAIVLAERGMTLDARTAARGCFETAFCLGALVNDKDFANAFVNDDADRRGKMARALLRGSVSVSLDANELTKLAAFVDEQRQSGVTAKPLKMIDAARLAGLDSIYDTYYRGISNDAAHPSIVALNSYVETDSSGEIVGLKWGPEVADIEDTMIVVCTGVIYLLYWTSELYPVEQASAGLRDCWKTYKSLVPD